MTEKGKMEKKVKSALYPLWIAVFIDILGFTILIPLFPFFMDSFNVNEMSIGVLMAVNAVFGFLFGPIWGALSDKYGRRIPLLISQFGTLASFILVAFSQTYNMLLFARILDGVFGGNYPIAKAIIGDVVPPKDRSKKMSNIGVAHILSSLIGPGVGGILFHYYGIIGPGLFAASLTIITIFLTVFKIKESNPVILEHRKHKENSQVEDIPLPKRVKVPLTSILKNVQARDLLIQWGFHTLSFMIYVSSITLYAVKVLGLNELSMGLYLTISGVARLFIRFYVFVPLLHKLGEKKTSILGLGLFPIAYFLLIFVSNTWQFLIILMIVSFAASCTRGVLISFLSRSVKRNEIGRAMGLNSSLDSFAQIFGPLIGAYILGSLSIGWYGATAGIVAILALLFSFKKLDFSHEKPALEGLERKIE